MQGSGFCGNRKHAWIVGLPLCDTACLLPKILFGEETYKKEETSK